VAAPSLGGAAGVAVGLLPGAPMVHVPPAVVSLVVLPPLLYAASEELPWRDLRAVWRPVMVLASAAAVAAVACGRVGGDGGDRGRAGHRRTAFEDHHRADATAIALGVPDRHLRAGGRRLRPHRAGAAHADPRARAGRAMAAGGAGSDRDPDRHPGRVGVPGPCHLQL